MMLWTATGHELHAAGAEPEDQDDGETSDEADQHDPVDSNGVPWKQTAGGKKSSIDGPWKPPSSVSRGKDQQVTALANSAISCFGASS